MTGNVPLAAGSDSIPVIVAVIAGIVSFIGAAITVVGTQRDREAKLQADRRELYARLMTALVTKTVPKAEAGNEDDAVALTLLIQRVRQASPSIRRDIDPILCPHKEHGLDWTCGEDELQTLQRAIDYQLKAFLFRNFPGVRSRARLASTGAATGTGAEETPAI